MIVANMSPRISVAMNFASSTPTNRSLARSRRRCNRVAACNRHNRNTRVARLTTGSVVDERTYSTAFSRNTRSTSTPLRKPGLRAGRANISLVRLLTVGGGFFALLSNRGNSINSLFHWSKTDSRNSRSPIL